VVGAHSETGEQGGLRSKVVLGEITEQKIKESLFIGILTSLQGLAIIKIRQDGCISQK